MRLDYADDETKNFAERNVQKSAENLFDSFFNETSLLNSRLQFMKIILQDLQI